MLARNLLQLSLATLMITSSGSGFAAAQSSKTKTADLAQFSSLYGQEIDAKDAIRRYQNLERLRVEAQSSLENLLKTNPSNNELKLRYAELL